MDTLGGMDTLPPTTMEVENMEDGPLPDEFLDKNLGFFFHFRDYGRNGDMLEFFK